MRPTVNLEGSIAQQRQVLEDGSVQRDRNMSPQQFEGKVSARDTEVSIASGVSIPVRVYTPTTLPTGTHGVPVAVYYHGGGWTLGSIAADDVFCRMIVRDLGHVVVSVAYRLAPEHQFPVAVNDCYGALRWV